MEHAFLSSNLNIRCDYSYFGICPEIICKIEVTSLRNTEIPVCFIDSYYSRVNDFNFPSNVHYVSNNKIIH